MANVTPFNDANFNEQVLKASGPVLVDFSATWCGPCKQLAPIVEELAKEYAPKGFKVGMVDIDENQELAGRYGIMSVPSLLIFQGGQVKDQIVGLMPKAKLAQRLDKVLAG